MELVIMTGMGSLAALIFAAILTVGILKKSEGTDKMKETAQYIREGANAY